MALLLLPIASKHFFSALLGLLCAGAVECEAFDLIVPAGDISRGSQPGVRPFIAAVFGSDVPVFDASRAGKKH